MNVLFLSAIFPYPLYSGGQVRIYNLLKHLSKKHTITLVSFIRSNEENSLQKELSFCHRIETIYRGRAWQPTYLLNSLFSELPFLYSTYAVDGAKERISKMIAEEQIDLVHAEPGYVYASLPRLEIPLTVAEHNIEHQIYQGFGKHTAFPLLKPYISYDVKKMRRMEKKIWNESSQIVAVSDEDKKEIAKISHRTISVVPNGVDLSLFTFQPREKLTHHFTALFVGSFRWLQNQDAVKRLLKDIWPAIRTKYPDAHLRIVGKSFPDSLKKLMTDGVSIEHDVEDIRDAYYTADMLIAPITIGGGTKYKILEAMAAGLLVLTTEKGIEGLPVADRKHVYLANSTESYVDAIDEIMKKPKERKHVLIEARRVIETTFSWDGIADTLDAVWRSSYETKH